MHDPTWPYSRRWVTVPKRQRQNPRANMLQVRERENASLGQPGSSGHSSGVGRKTDDLIPQTALWKSVLSSVCILDPYVGARVFGTTDPQPNRSCLVSQDLNSFESFLGALETALHTKASEGSWQRPAHDRICSGFCRGEKYVTIRQNRARCQKRSRSTKPRKENGLLSPAH